VIDKAQRPHIDAIMQRVIALRRVGERSHHVPGLEQALGDVPSAVAERPRDDMKFLSRHGWIRVGAND